MDSPQSYINKYGGKAGGWFYLRDHGGFEGHLLPLYYLSPDAEVDSVADILPDEIRCNWLLRGTHKNDHEGFVDILHSIRLIGFDKERPAVLEQIKKNITKIRENANHPEIFAYSKYEGQPYDGKIGVAIQPYNPGVRGSIVEHPHERGTYLLDTVKLNIENDTIIDRLVVKGNKIDDKQSRMHLFSNWDGVAEEVVDLYDRVKETKFVPLECSFQMEFGINKSKFVNKKEIIFYQARPFLKFQEPPFSLNVSELYKYSCFGITPEDGITLPVVKTTFAQGANEIEHEFAWIVQNITSRNVPQSRPKNMRIFLPIGNRVNSLEHNVYRWVRKAEVSILSPDDDFIFNEYKNNDKIRIISNGIYHRIESLHDLQELTLPHPDDL